MRSSRLCPPLGLSLCLLLAGTSPPAYAQKKEDKPSKLERVRFDTVDQVEIEGTYWPSTRGRNAPVAMLLHRYGGNSHEDGWDALAEALQQKGFAVLSFDFRGHGSSTKVGPGFWAADHNPRLVRGYKRGLPAQKQPTSISHKAFSQSYIPFLVNDIAAAKMYLERRNDSSECNVSNLVLIGAEEGATLGALWLASETHRYKLLPGGTRFLPRMSPKPESKDVIAAIWLTPSRSLGRIPVPLPTWIHEAGREHKVPMAFLYGEEDGEAKQLAKKLVKVIRPNKPANDEYKATGEKGVAKTKLAGSKLLSDALNTKKWIVGDYLDKTILENHGGNEWEKREAEEAPYTWVFGRRTVAAKRLGSKNLLPLPLALLGIR